MKLKLCFGKNRKLRVAVGNVEKPLTVSESTAKQGENGEHMAISSKMSRIQPTEHMIFLLSPLYDKTFVLSQFSHNVLTDVTASANRVYNLWLQVCLQF